MKNQEKFKEDTNTLYNAVKDYTRKYSHMGGSRMLQSPSDLFAAQLRMALECVWTEEESEAQRKADGRM